MGVLLLIGTILFAYGPAFAVILSLSKQRPYLFLVALMSGLFSIICLFLGGLIYTIWNAFAKPDTYIMMFVVIGIEEILRPLFFMLLNYLCTQLNKVNVDIHMATPSETFKFSLSSGLGFSIVSSAFVSLISLTSSSTPGTYVISGSPLDIFIQTSLQTFMIHFLYIAWYYITIYGYCYNKYIYYILIFVWHVAHGFSFGLRTLDNGYIIQFCFMGLETIIAFACIILLVKRTVFMPLPRKD